MFTYCTEYNFGCQGIYVIGAKW